MAGVPRGSLVVVAATLPYFGLPQEGLLLVLAIDHVLDMGRSATNVIGNSIAAVAVAKWEGEPLLARSPHDEQSEITATQVSNPIAATGADAAVTRAG